MLFLSLFSRNDSIYFTIVEYNADSCHTGVSRIIHDYANFILMFCCIKFNRRQYCRQAPYFDFSICYRLIPNASILFSSISSNFPNAFVLLRTMPSDLELLNSTV